MLSGRITGGETLRLRNLVAQAAPGRKLAIILDSPGGDLFEGLELGRYFHEARITTFVKGSGGICYSACSLAFLGGRDTTTGAPARIKMSGGKLGFHQFNRAQFDPLKIYNALDFDREVTAAQQVTRAVAGYLKAVGDGIDKMQLMLSAPTEGMNIVSNEDCLARGIKVLDEATGRVIEPGTARVQTSMITN